MSGQKPNNDIDDKDYAILKILQQDCSKTDVELSKELSNSGINLGAAACGNRIKALKKEKYITSMKAILDYEKFGINQTCFMLVNMIDKDQDSVEEFILSAIKEPTILEIHEMTGICDYLMKVRVVNMAEATRLSKKLSKKVHIHTHAAGEARKEETAIRLHENSKT